MENLDFDTLNSLAIRRFKTDRELVSKLRVLKKNFTIDRESLGEYLTDEELVSAYACYYMPTNFPKLKYCFDLLPQNLIEEISGTHLIDLGTGPGTFMLAFVDYLKQRGFKYDGEIVGVETSELMIRQAKKLINGLLDSDSSYSIVDPRMLKSVLNRMKGGGRTVLFGNSLNEMEDDQVISYLQEVDPRHVIFIEPGTPLVFEKVLKVRTWLKDNSYNIHYPCPAGVWDCPLTGQIGDWCHQIINVKHHPSMERISQMAQMDRNKLPLIFHVYSRTNLDHAVDEKLNHGVVIQILKETKFSFNLRVCTPDKKIETVEILKKSMSKKECKNFSKIACGEIIGYELIKELGDGRLRVITK